MVDIEKASKLAVNHCRYKVGAFYGSPSGLALGVGIVYDSIRYPLLDDATNLYDTVEGLVYVLTHECDIDPLNERIFNEYVLVCPIIRFEHWAVELAASMNEGALFGLIPDLSQDKIFRAFYLPPLGEALPFGGVLYFNQICSAHRNSFASAEAISALSTYAQRIIDMKLQNHFFRPKSDQLPLIT